MNSVKIKPEVHKQFTFDLLQKSKIDPKEASVIAEIFTWFDLAGRYTQGLWRLLAYLKRFQAGLIKSPCAPEFIQKSDTICIIDGHDGFGYYLGHIAMVHAIEMSRNYGLGLVGVNHSNHLGGGAYYVELAAKESQIGFAMTNSFPKVAPHGGISSVLGTNPFAFSAPVENGQSILIDFSTSASAGSMIRKALEENKNIPEGLVIDEQGKSILNPRKASDGTILPFGGAKGFCLGLLVEILSGVIAGAGISHEVGSMYKNFDKPANIGHLFLAIDISKIMPMEEYYSRISKLIKFVKESKLMKGFDEIHIPGETRWRNMEKQHKEGIQLDAKTVELLTNFASSIGVPTPW